MKHPLRSRIGAAARLAQSPTRGTVPLSLWVLCVLAWPSLAGGADPFVEEKPTPAASTSSGADGFEIEPFIPAASAFDITIDGPKEMKVGEAGEFYLLGTPPIDLDKPLKDQLDWAIGEHAMGAYLAVPGEPLQPLAVRLELVITLDGFIAQPLLKFSPTKNGEHRMVIDWNFDGNQLSEHRIQVGEAPPPPPPPPPPDTKYQVGIFLESSDRESLPKGQREIISSLAFRQELERRGHKWLTCFVYDKDCTSPDGIPDKLKPWWEAIKGDPTPRIAMAPLSGGAIKDFPLPANPDAVWKLLEEGKP